MGVLDIDPSAADETAAPAARGASDAPPLTRRGRVRKFDRPPPPKDWRWWISGLGKILIATGLLMFGFVAYQLWGTGIENARAQASLENEFEQLLAETPPVTTLTPAATVPAGADTAEPDSTAAPSETTPDGGTQPDVVEVEDQNIPPVVEGDAIARLEIPRIDRNDIVVAGVAKSDLKRGPGHYPETPLPGQLGNAAIAGHRTTYGQPFFDVDKLEPGDEIIATTLSGRFVYRVTDTRIVTPDDYWVVATTDPDVATLTLTSCHPKWTARERIIIFAELDAAASTPVGAPVLNYGRPDEPVPRDTDDVAAPDASAPAASVPAASVPGDSVPGDSVPGDSVPGDSVPGNSVDAEPSDSASDDSGAAGSQPSGGTSSGMLTDTDAAGDTTELGSDGLNAEIADAFGEGWFSDPDANGQVLLWGLLLAAIGILSYLISRKFKRDWVGAMVGIVPFVVTLYFFFQNVNRLLPPNL